MDIALDIISWIFLVTGSFFCLTGALGLLRFPEFFSRIHAASITDTLGASLILVGLMFQAGWGLALPKLILILMVVTAVVVGDVAAVKAAAARLAESENALIAFGPMAAAGENGYMATTLRQPGDIYAVLSDGMPDTGSITPVLFCGWTSIRIQPFSPTWGRNLSCVPVSRNSTLCTVLVSVVVTM